MKLLLLAAFSIFSSNVSTQDSNINVAIAASLQKPFEEIISKFEETEKIKIKLVSASSGTLSTQIRNNAPFDILVSANRKFAEDLVIEGLAISSKPFCRGSLVWWCRSPVHPDRIGESIKAGDIRNIAIANPDLAPYGMAALKWLKENNIEVKLIYGENIGSVNRYIFSNAVDGAITSLSSMHAPELSQNGFWFPLENANQSDSLVQEIALIKSSNAAKKFYDFILSDAVRIILSKYGYNPIDNGE